MNERIIVAIVLILVGIVQLINVVNAIRLQERIKKGYEEIIDELEKVYKR